MAVGGMVRHPVQKDADAAGMGLGDHAIRVTEGAEHRVDVAIVGDVVAEVLHGGAKERRDPEGVDAKPAKMLEPRRDSSKVADAVAGRIQERPRIDLVDHGISPPLRAGTTGTGGRHAAEWDRTPPRWPPISGSETP